MIKNSVAQNKKKNHILGKIQFTKLIKDTVHQISPILGFEHEFLENKKNIRVK